MRASAYSSLRDSTLVLAILRKKSAVASGEDALCMTGCLEGDVVICVGWLLNEQRTWLF